MVKKKLIQNAPQSSRAPRIPTRLPASWGKARGRFYGALVQTMKDSSVPDEILTASLLAVRYLEGQCPRASDAFLTAAWGAIREWHSARPDNIGSMVACPQCGERRCTRFMGEGHVVSHAMIKSVEPPVVFVVPNGCEHHSFSIACKTCGAEVTSALNPLADLTGTHDTNPADKDYTLN